MPIPFHENNVNGILFPAPHVSLDPVSSLHPMREQTNVQSLQEEELNRAKEQVAKETEQLKNTLNARQLEMRCV